MRRTMKRFVLTGAPGSGKTSILRVLAATGYAVVEEAATDVNVARLAAGTPSRGPTRCSSNGSRCCSGSAGRSRSARRPRHRCTTGQRYAHWRSRTTSAARSPRCWKRRSPGSPRPGTSTAGCSLSAPLGFLQPTEVRRISYEESLVFERVLETGYLRLGFEIVDVPASPVAERAAAIDADIRSRA